MHVTSLSKMYSCFILLIFILNLSSIISCPPQEDLYPCICQASFKGNRVTCSYLENHNVLRDAVHALHHAKIFSFVIRNANFMYLPHDIFKSIKINELEMKSASFMALTDTDIAFEGIEDELLSLKIIDCEVLNDWNWSVLRKLTMLAYLQVDVNLEIISEDIVQINASNLFTINFDNNKISHIYDKAFAKFKKVVQLSLKNNFISDVQRSMLPRPADVLTVLELSHNNIQELPSDMFADMPVLHYLNLDSNKILTLNEQTFSKVWQQLKLIDVSDNPLRCDCRLLWVVDRKFPPRMNAVCDQPLNLKEKSLKDLSETDLWC